MNVHILVTYFGSKHTIERKGNFFVNDNQFKKNADKAVAEVAFNWFKNIRKEHHVNEVIKVIYNKEHDITALVKELERSFHL